MVGTAYEFTTVNGCKSDRGFTGDLVGNAASATKLQDDTAFIAWGQTFFENGKPKNVSGDLTNAGNITASGNATIQGDIVCGGEVVAVTGEGTPAGVTDYSALTGKPSINGKELISGDNTLAELGIQPAGDYITESLLNTKLDNYTTKTFVSNNYAGKAAFNSHTADTDIHITAAERVDWNAKWNYNENTIKAVKVTSASSADSVAWTGIKDKPTTFNPSAHTHTASEISGLPTNLSAFTNDVGFITGITKSMVEGVLTGNITSHTHTFASLTSKPTTLSGYGITDAYTATTIDSKLSGYLPLSGGTIDAASWKALVLDNSVKPTDGIALQLSINKTNKGTITYNGEAILLYNATSKQYLSIKDDGTPTYNGSNTLIHSGNIGLYNAGGIIGKLWSEKNTPNLLTTWNDWGGKAEMGYMSYSYGIYSVAHDITYQFLLGADALIDGLFFRRRNLHGWGDWKVIAFTDSNVASATKLQTPRNIWGQSFDGTSDVNGDAHITGDLIVDGEVSALVA